MTRSKHRASFQTRIAVWLLASQGLLWVVVLPWNFWGSVQTVHQLRNPALEDGIRETWDAARQLEQQHPELRNSSSWTSLTSSLEGVLRDYQSNKSLQTDVIVQRFQGLLALAFLQLLGLVVTAVLAARTLSRQVRRIHEVVVRLGQGDRTTRLPEQKGREFHLLGQEFNRLMDSLDAQQARLSELGKLLGWQETARFLSHQIKNPLTALSLAARNLDELGAIESPLAQKNAAILNEESERLLHLVNRLKELTSFGELRPERIDLSLLVSEAAQHRFPLPVHFSWEGIKPFWLTADKLFLEQVFLNLIVNSAEAALPTKPFVEVTVRAEGASLWLTDSISGLPEDLPDKLFHPPFTTKASGTGLGLTFCRRILQLHGGNLTVDLTPQKGLRFHLEFGEVTRVEDTGH